MNFSNFAYADETQINKNWTIQSDSRSVLKKAKYILKKNKKKEIAEIETAIQKRLKLDRYLTAKVSLNPKDKIIKIDNLKKYMILFEGNKSLSNKIIKGSIDLDNLISSEDTIKDDLILRIKQTYTKNGFNDIKINVDEKSFNENKVIRYLFKIDEGLVYSFDKITINGTFSKRKKFYTNFLKAKSSSLVKSGKFSKTDIENGLNNLITHLRNLGYLDASYSGLRIEREKNTFNKVHVFFDLYEGQPTRVQNIRFIGNKTVDSEWLTVLLGFKENQILDFNKLETGIKLVYDYYMSTGYLDVQINPQKKDFIELNSEKRKADIVVEIIEGEKVIVGDIAIEGLIKTKPYVVKNIINFEVGDVLTIEKIQNSKRQLNISGLFGRVDIDFEEVNESTNSRRIKIEVEEKKPGVVQLGFGARFNQRALSLKGYTGVLYKNLGGTARAINTRGELQSRINEDAYPEYRAFISYYEPFVFRKDVRGRVGVDASENIFEITGTKTTIFRSLGLDFVIENNFNRHIKAAWTVLGINLNKEFAIRNTGPAVSEIREQIGYFGPTLQFDYRNDLFVPTKGYFLRLQSEYGSPNLGTKIEAKGREDDVKYIRNEATYTQYSSVLPELVLVNTIRGGWLKNLSDGTNSFPKSRAFFLGGSSTIRGYDPSDGVNERIPSDQDLGVDTSARGGDVLAIPDDSFFYLLKTEMRFPLFSQLWGSLFYDGGSVLIDQISQKDPYRDAAGFGVRYLTPIGALTIDLGFKLDQDKSRGESLERVHINIGTF